MRVQKNDETVQENDETETIKNVTGRNELPPNNLRNKSKK